MQFRFTCAHMCAHVHTCIPKMTSLKLFPWSCGGVILDGSYHCVLLNEHAYKCQRGYGQKSTIPYGLIKHLLIFFNRIRELTFENAPQIN